MDNSVLDKVKSIIAEVLDVPVQDITEETAIGDIEAWDSLHHIQIVAAIEKEFDFRFTPDVMMELEDVEDIVAAVEARVSK